MMLHRVSVFGVGYVGAVTAACLSQSDFEVIATDPNELKVKMTNQGLSPIVEPYLQEMIQCAVDEKKIEATSDGHDAIMRTDLSLICVGTPSRPNGSLDTTYIESVCREIGFSLKKKIKASGRFHSVVLRSTILPGTMDETVLPILEECSGYKAGVEFGLGYYPEFLREGTAIKDYFNPGAVIFGAIDVTTIERLNCIVGHLPVEPYVTDISTAEAVKYANNIWHAVKISYANEIGNICTAYGIDSHVVMNIVCSDKRLNISEAYMTPGMAFGGSCLPKDLRAMRHGAKKKNILVPIIEAVLEANENQVEKAFELVNELRPKKVAMIGLSFKSHTDDLRESPLVDLAVKLYSKGYDMQIFDPNVQVDRLSGENKKIFDRDMPFLSALMVDNLERMIDEVDTVIVGNSSIGLAYIIDLLEGTDKNVVDLVRLNNNFRTNRTYKGLCW